MSVLANSYLIRNLEKDGEWETAASETKIEYRCLKCGRRAEAILEVIPLRTTENKGVLGQRYLAERRAFCVRLVTQENGRCLGTGAVSMRAGGLTGFQSRHELKDRRVTEILFFYGGGGNGPEIIRTTISVETGASVPLNLAEVFRWHMARLTSFW